jgi:hypothetical protein
VINNPANKHVKMIAPFLIKNSIWLGFKNIKGSHFRPQPQLDARKSNVCWIFDTHTVLKCLPQMALALKTLFLSANLLKSKVEFLVTHSTCPNHVKSFAIESQPYIGN